MMRHLGATLATVFALSGALGCAESDSDRLGEGGTLDPAAAPTTHKADGDGSGRLERYQTKGHRLSFGETRSVTVRGSQEVALRFYAAADVSVSVTAEGTALRTLEVAGPKPLGADWPTAFDGLSFGPNDVTTLEATLSDAGLYAVVVSSPALDENTTVTFDITLSCLELWRCSPFTWSPQAQDDDTLSLLAVGDLGLTVSRAPIDPLGGAKYGKYHLYEEMLEGFEPWIDADINLVNVETAITSAGGAVQKQFAFRMPPTALSRTLDAGFNLAALANNHCGDYHDAGVRDTLEHFADARADGRLFGYAGAGESFEEAAAPAVFEVDGLTVAFASAGIGWNVRYHNAGIAHISDGAAVIDWLAETDADLRIFALHGGTERQLTPTSQIQALADHAAAAGIDVFHGHHPHVVQGIRRKGDTLIMYSMGNFALRGATNMGRYGVDRDYGLAARLSYDREAGRINAIEAIPLYDMHMIVTPLLGADGDKRLERLNRLSGAFGDEGVLLELDGSGRGRATW